MSSRPRVVIVGGGFGGLRTALLLSRQRIPIEIVLVDTHAAHVYTPWLYEVASGRTEGMSRSEKNALRHSASFSFTDIFVGTGVTFRHDTVVGIDDAHRHVVMNDGTTMHFDALVLAVGSESATFGIPGLAEHALRLKTVDDATAIFRCITKCLDDIATFRLPHAHIVVGGAGASGVELVAELATMVAAQQRRGALPPGELRFSLVDAEENVLAACSPSVRRATEQRLRRLGVTLMLNTMITKLSADVVTLSARSMPQAKDATGVTPLPKLRDVAYNCFVWCGGVAPHHGVSTLPFAHDKRGRILVEPTFEISGMVNMFALGDVATFVGAESRTLPQTAQAADTTATYVAENVVRGLQKRALKKYVLPKHWSFVVAVGGAYGVADIFGVTLTGRAAYMLRRLADLRYCLRTFRFFTALAVWRSRMKLYAKND